MLRKVMLLAAMLAMVLAAAAPAFAQAVVEDGDETAVQYVDCSQVQQAIQGQYGDANAAADDGSIAQAANTLGISQTQVNACLGGIEGDVDAGAPGVGDQVIVEGEDGEASVVAGTASPEAEASASASASASATAAASAPAELPETGGASLLALGAGALLVAGGLVARRIVR